MPISPGARLGSYEILAPIGAGGMGEIWKARDTRISRVWSRSRKGRSGPGLPLELAGALRISEQRLGQKVANWTSEIPK